jgi:TolB-like protein/DNA-binding winged helix-turn-helix (wHTH) protein/Flp pilus assembly protein TadD
MSKQTRHFYEFGSFSLDAERRLLQRNGDTISLPPKVLDTLLALIKNREGVLTKDELLNLVWGETIVEEGGLARNVSVLRKALGERPDDHHYIVTVPGRGYQFVADVEERWENGKESSEPMPVETKIGLRPKGILSAHRRLILGGLAALALGIPAYLLISRTILELTQPEIRSLAVLPLQNLSGDPEQEYFADGMTEALTASLARMRALRVVSRTAVMRFKGSQKPLLEISRDLNADALIVGSVQPAGGRVKIMIQLIDGRTDTRLWTRDYDLETTNILKLQTEVARDVGRRIRVKLSPEEQLHLGSAPPVNPEAYDHYLRGRYYANRQNKEDNEAAVLSLERAVAIDSTFASAYAELAQAYVWKFYLFAPQERKWEEKAFVAAEKALSLDPDLPMAYLARGRLLWTPVNHFPHERAIREYRRALDLNPELDEARNQLALIYCHIGLFDEALQESQKAVETNPINNMAVYRMAQTLIFQGKYEQALSVLRTIPEKVNPALVGYLIPWALFNLGRKEEASDSLEHLLQEYPEDSGGLYTSLQALLTASIGQERQAENRINEAVERGKGFGHFHHTAYHIACSYALMNKPEPAIKWLEAAAQDGFPCYPLFERDANLDNLRRDARFIRFMARLRQQWERYRTLF